MVIELAFWFFLIGMVRANRLRSKSIRSGAWSVTGPLSNGLDGHTEKYFETGAGPALMQGVEDETGRLSKVGGRG